MPSPRSRFPRDADPAAGERREPPFRPPWTARAGRWGARGARGGRAERSRWGLRRRLSVLFAFVALAAVSLTTLFTLGAVADLERELTERASPFSFLPPWGEHDAKSDRHGPSGAEFEAFRRVTRTAFVAALLSFVLASATAAVATRRLTRPLAALTDGARRLAQGERGVRLAPPPGHDELRTLTLAFNALTEGLERQEAWRRDVVADIAHDLRTPLAVLRSEVEALQDGVRPRDDAALARLHAEVMTLSRLVTDLRTLSLAESGGLELRREPLRARSLLDELASAFAGRADATGSAVEVVANPEVRVVADRLQLRRLLGNLLDNALRYAPGPVTLGARPSPDGGAELWVRDHGPGLSPEALERAFERFYRGDRARGRDAAGERGSGLGLAIARAVAEVHGGELVAENLADGEGGGARFTVRLPPGPDASDPATTAEPRR